jgi:predicted DNA binding CopG/RHH family protein
VKPRIPEFKSDKEIADFWDSHSISDFDHELEEAKDIIFVRPQRQSISIRLDKKYVQVLKALASEHGIGYSSLLRMWLIERIKREIKERKMDSPD